MSSGSVRRVSRQDIQLVSWDLTPSVVDSEDEMMFV